MNLVVCTACEYQTDPSRQGNNAPCHVCNKTRMMVDPATILCNMCGERTRPKGTVNEAYEFGLENLIAYGGYDSTYLNDTVGYKFNLCECCLRKMFNQFQIPPETREGMCAWADKTPISYHQDMQYHQQRLKNKQYSDWILSGAAAKAYEAGLCNVEENCPEPAIYSLYFDGEISDLCCCDKHDQKYAAYAVENKPFVNSKIRKFL